MNRHKAARYKDKNWLLQSPEHFEHIPLEYWDDHFFVIAAVGRHGADVFKHTSDFFHDDIDMARYV